MVVIGPIDFHGNKLQMSLSGGRSCPDDFLFLTTGEAAEYLSCARDDLIAWVKPDRRMPGQVGPGTERGAGPNRPSIGQSPTSKRGGPAIAPKQPNALRQCKPDDGLREAIPSRARSLRS